ncbi:MAG: hypothetical protein GY759_12590 [Chloroflexi bacterium]|nr:hypothetical protein [Chloroflexota bacterium]
MNKLAMTAPDAMTPRQRFLTALACERPDRVPLFDFLFCPNLYEHVIGRRPETYNAEDAVALTKALELDAVQMPVWAADSFKAHRPAPDIVIDEWGVTLQENPAHSWPNGAPVAHPLKTRCDWQNYTPPDVAAPGRLQELQTALQLAAGGLAVIGAVNGPLTSAWWLTGLDTFSLMLYDDPDLAHEILRLVTDWSISAGKMMATAGADALFIADDHGSTHGTLISPAFFKQFIYPYFDELVSVFRGLGLPVIMHNDGQITTLLDDLVAMGIDGYHPVERAAAMNLADVKTRYAGRLCLFGNVDNKTTLVSGCKDEVVRETLECLRVAAPGGGYVLGSDHSLHDALSVENVLTMFDTAKRYGAGSTALELGVHFLRRFSACRSENTWVSG